MIQRSSTPGILEELVFLARSPGLWLLLLFRHCAKSLHAQKERLATSPQLVTGLHLPHAIVERLHVRKSNAGHSWRLSRNLSLSVGISIQGEVMDVARSAPQGAHYHADVVYLLT